MEKIIRFYLGSFKFAGECSYLGVHERIIAVRATKECFICTNVSNTCSRIPVCTIFFCSTMSEFENFLLCERILINVTTCQN
jgi:hypothetical protein